MSRVSVQQKQKNMSDVTEKSLPNLIKDIVFFYVKYYYDKKVQSLGVNQLTEQQIEEFIEEHYTNKEKELREYIRKSLKKNQGDAYSSIATENILLEMFSDAEMAKERIRLEIQDFQENHS
jgi:hypothetical protein